ncbi:hypothetical protein HYV80_01640 [Candidatus Woesearchaeota archaeon]|nr:hypothetical protein [Candidatus Woesearchaeota archaeon]
MIKSRKGVALPVEFLVRVLFMIFLVIVVFNVGKEAGKYIFAGFFGTDLEKNFEEFADELNKPFTANAPSRQAFITLDSNTAIIGFSTSADSFRCFGCGSESPDITSFFDKPNSNECSGKSCVCLCPKPLQINTGTKPYEMKCDKIKCIAINKDIAETVELKNYIDKIEKETQVEYRYLKNAKWTGGFLFERHSRGDFVSNGIPQPQGRKFSVYVNKEGTGDNFFLSVCPGPDCKYTLKEEQKIDVPPEICRIIKECAGYRIPTGTENYCSLATKPPRPAALIVGNEEDCEKVKSCVQQNPKIKTQGKCQPLGTFYELSFLPEPPQKI